MLISQLSQFPRSCSSTANRKAFTRRLTVPKAGLIDMLGIGKKVGTPAVPPCGAPEEQSPHTLHMHVGFLVACR
jgi:hypothetical protein